MSLVFVVETGSPSRFLNWCDCVYVGREGGGRANRDGGGERRGGKKGCLIVCRGGVPWVLEKVAGWLAGWSWAEGLHYLSVGFSHCSKSLFVVVSGITHPSDF